MEDPNGDPRCSTAAATSTAMEDVVLVIEKDQNSKYNKPKPYTSTAMNIESSRSSSQLLTFKNTFRRLTSTVSRKISLTPTPAPAPAVGRLGGGGRHLISPSARQGLKGLQFLDKKVVGKSRDDGWKAVQDRFSRLASADNRLLRENFGACFGELAVYRYVPDLRLYICGMYYIFHTGLKG